jgi:hypothetical protein
MQRIRRFVMAAVAGVALTVAGIVATGADFQIEPEQPGFGITARGADLVPEAKPIRGITATGAD